MAGDKRLETLQEEIKLLKGEVKNSLSSVRDYLLSMELPSSEFSTILAALNPEGGNQKVTLDGNVANAKGTEPEIPGAEEETEEEVEEEANDEIEEPSDEDLLDVEEPGEEPAEGMSEELADDSALGEEQALNEEEALNPEDTMLPEEEVAENEDLNMPEESAENEDLNIPEESTGDEELTPESELPTEEEQPMETDRTAAEIKPYMNEPGQSIPKVNMLANLIGWVAKARKEIGYEQLPTFLEVYGISGHLSPELKEVIIHLAEITDESSDAETDSEIWSQSMLSLHGILTGGDAPVHPVIPSWVGNTSEPKPTEEEIIEVDKSKEKPVKLKLVFPNGNGKDKEFCIDLTPEEDNHNPSPE